MSEIHKIRWKQSDYDDLRKTVKNFNAKISRLEKRIQSQIDKSDDGQERIRLRQQMAALPEKVTQKEMKDIIHTRQDLKRELNSLKRFSKRGAEELTNIPIDDDTVQITKWQKNEMSRRVAVINRRRADRLEVVQNYQVKQQGKDVGYTIGDVGMGKVDEVSLRPMNAFTPKMNRRDVNKRFKAIKKESSVAHWSNKEIALKENVIKGIEANYKGMFPEETEELIKAISKMSFKEFYKRFMEEPGEMEIVSPPPGSDMDEMMRINMEALKSTWIPEYVSPMLDDVEHLKDDLKQKHSKEGKEAKQKTYKVRKGKLAKRADIEGEFWNPPEPEKPKKKRRGKIARTADMKYWKQHKAYEKSKAKKKAEQNKKNNGKNKKG